MQRDLLYLKVNILVSMKKSNKHFVRLGKMNTSKRLLSTFINETKTSYIKS